MLSEDTIITPLCVHLAKGNMVVGGDSKPLLWSCLRSACPRAAAAHATVCHSHWHVAPCLLDCGGVGVDSGAISMVSRN